jgi:hypothetical protein
MWMMSAKPMILAFLRPPVHALLGLDGCEAFEMSVK